MRDFNQAKVAFGSAASNWSHVQHFRFAPENQTFERTWLCAA